MGDQAWSSGNAPTAGFTKHVGSRTSFRVLNHGSLRLRNWWPSLPRDDPALWPFPSTHENLGVIQEFRRHIWKPAVCGPFAGNDSLYLNFDHFRALGIAVPSTGLRTVCVLRRLCARISIFGLDVGPQQAHAPHHYFETDGALFKRTNDTQHIHNFTAEHALLRAHASIQDGGVVSMHRDLSRLCGV